jgi:hypothetical protein
MEPGEEGRAVAMFEREPGPAPVTDAIAQEARRYAAFYPAGTDGRNTFEIFAKFVEDLAMQAAKPVGDSNTKIVKLRAELEELYRREPSTDQPKIRRSIINETGPSIIGRLQQIDHLQRYHIACLEHALAVKPIEDSEVVEVLRGLLGEAIDSYEGENGRTLIAAHWSSRAAALLAKLDRKEGEGL